MNLVSLFPCFLTIVFVHATQQLEVLQQRVVVNSSELCILALTPSLFKWDRKNGFMKQVEYMPRLENSPDIPSWLQYTYDDYNSLGYLYGVPPPSVSSLNLDVVAFNRGEAYNVRKLIISMEVVVKEERRYVVELKIDNLNVKDLAVPKRMEALASVLANDLGWRRGTIVPVFLGSAVALGENRIPIGPNDAEGVMVHLASNVDFSPELKKLRGEVNPLWKLRPCPREFKRTSVERHFRHFNFLVDWCSFRLTTLRDSNASEDESGASSNVNNGVVDEGGVGGKTVDSEQIFHFRSEVPEREYGFQLLMATLIPGSIGGLIGFLLIVLLRTDRDEDSAIDHEALFFEAAFRNLFALLRIKQRYGQQDIGNGGSRKQYASHPHHETLEHDDVGIVLLTRDNELDQFITEGQLENTPTPPQYTETHPNGAPALIYAV